MKRMFIIIVVILLVLAVPLTVLLTLRNQELRKKATPATTLKFTPQSISKKVGEEFTLEARIETADNDVVAADITVVYDPTKVEALTITNGSLFPNILSSGTIGEGLASISVGAANASSPIHGEGIAISIKFKALEATISPVSIRFSPNTFIGALGEQNTNVLTASIPATVTISGENTYIEPSPTPTTILSGTSKPTATLTPTPSYSATITPTPAPIVIIAPNKNESIKTQTPTIQGTAPVGTEITITVYSDPITASIIVDSAGNWSYTVPEALAEGPHTVVVAAVDPVTGQSTSATLAFVVATGEESEVPVSGISTPLFISLMTGMVFMLIGLLFGLFMKG